MKLTRGAWAFLLAGFFTVTGGSCGVEEGDASGTEAVDTATSAVAASVCGAGYKLIGVIPMVNNEGVKGSELEVFYNAAAGKNCLVNQSLGSMYGKKKRMIVRVCPHALTDSTCNAAPFADYGDYFYYAGPVYVTAPHQCIYYLGLTYLDVTSHVPPNGGSLDIFGASGKGFCG